MDELFSFIRSLKNANRDNINDYYYKLSGLIETIDLQGAKKYRDNDGYGLELNNICISSCRNPFYRCISILINHKYIIISTNNTYYGILEYEHISDIIWYDENKGDKFLNIECQNSIEVKDGSVDWLLDQKIPKSARK